MSTFDMGLARANWGSRLSLGPPETRRVTEPGGNETQREVLPVLLDGKGAGCIRPVVLTEELDGRLANYPGWRAYDSFGFHQDSREKADGVVNTLCGEMENAMLGAKKLKDRLRWTIAREMRHAAWVGFGERSKANPSDPQTEPFARVWRRILLRLGLDLWEVEPAERHNAGHFCPPGWREKADPDPNTGFTKASFYGLGYRRAWGAATYEETLRIMQADAEVLLKRAGLWKTVPPAKSRLRKGHEAALAAGGGSRENL